MSPKINHDMAIIKLWVPVVCFAHAFAAFWFIKLFLLTDSNALKALTRRRRRASQQNLPKQRNSEDDEGKSEDVVLALSTGASPAGRCELQQGARQARDCAHRCGVQLREEPASRFCSPAPALGPCSPLPACLLLLSSSSTFSSSCSSFPLAAVGADSDIPGSDHGSAKEEEGLEVKVERVHLEWQGVCCSYNSGPRKIVVLQDIWGQALPGEMQVRAPRVGSGGWGRTLRGPALPGDLAREGARGRRAGLLLRSGRLAVGEGSCCCCCCSMCGSTRLHPHHKDVMLLHLLRNCPGLTLSLLRTPDTPRKKNRRCWAPRAPASPRSWTSLRSARAWAR